MPTLKLTYFDFNGGRGETARLALSIGGIEFEDDRIKFADWAKLKPNTPFHAMPVLEVDGQAVAQSNGINRYVGKLAGLYPEDPLQAAFCDEAMSTVEELAAVVAPTFSIKDEEEKKVARQALVDGPLTFFLERLQSRLEARGGRWFADDRLTVADIKVFLSLRHIRSGNLDYVPADLPERVAPLLVELFDRVNDHEGIKAYYEARQVS